MNLPGNTPDSASGQGPAASASPAPTNKTDRHHPGHARDRWSLAAIVAGAVVVIGTYVAVLATQPATIATDLGTAALWVMLGYLAGGALIAVGAARRMLPGAFALMPVAIALNVVVGQIVGTMTPLPVYLDSLGTVLVAALAGPAAGALTGILTNIVWGVAINPSVIAFSAGAAFVGAAAGWAARLGSFRAIWSAIVAGAIVGVPTGALAAPVAAFVYGGGLGVGTGGLVATLQAAGLEMIGATTAQSLASDIADKAIVFVLAFLVLRTLPRRILDRAPYARFSFPGGR